MRKKVIFHCLAINRYYVNCFLDYLLPSLFHKSNLFFLQKYDVELLVSTTKNDSEVILQSNILNIYENLVTLSFHIIDDASYNNKLKYKIPFMMARAHSAGVKIAMEKKSFASFLSPDMVVNSRYLITMDYCIEKNFKACLSPAFRMTYLDDFLMNLQNNTNHARDDHDQGYSSRQLLSASLKNLHQETSSFFFENDSFLQYQNYATPTGILFKNMHNEQLLGFGMSWFLVMLNFSNISKDVFEECINSLREHTIDSYFLSIFLNREFDNVYFVRDSDEVTVISWDRSKQIMKPPSLNPVLLTEKQKIDIVSLGATSGIYDLFKLRHFSRFWIWNPTHEATDFSLESYKIPYQLENRLLSFKFQSHFAVLRSYVLYYIATRKIRKVKKSLSPFSVFLSRWEALRSSASQLALSLANRISIKYYVFFIVFFFVFWVKLGFLLCYRFSRRIFQNVKKKVLLFSRLIFLLITFKRNISNPLNQAIGGRFHSILRFLLVSRIQRNLNN